MAFFCLTVIPFMPKISRMLAASHDNVEGLNESNQSANPSATPKPRIWLGVRKGLQAAKDAIEDKNLDLAEELLREVIEFAPAEPETWHILAAVLNRKGHIEEAKQCLRRVLKLQETNIELQTELPVSKRMAKLLWSQDEHAAALAMLAQLLLDDPSDQELLALQQTWTAAS